MRCALLEFRSISHTTTEGLTCISVQALQAAVQRIESYVKVLEDKVGEMAKKQH